MTERQKKLLEILEEIGETEPKRKSKRSAEKGLRDGIEKAEALLVQEGLLEKEPAEKLTKAEREEMLDACLQMRTDRVETLNVCMSLNAFFVSILSLIVSVTATVLTVLKTVDARIVITLAVFSFAVMAGAVVLLFSAARRADKNAKKADQYRNAYILLRFLQEE